MTKLLSITFALAICSYSIAQTSVFNDDFESGSSLWTLSGDLSPNSWIFNSCSGNGTSAAGSNAMYITSGGTIPGCGITGTEQHAYVDAPTGTHQTVSSASIDAGCLTSLTASFDYSIDGILTEDFAELVYSTNGGTTWTVVGLPLSIASAWTSINVSPTSSIKRFIIRSWNSIYI